jgi:hypothetical protein
MQTPIIIVGAGRSGTKLLRGVLGQHPSLIAFPREINYIWRYKNARCPTDELSAEQATPAVVKYITRRIEQFSAANGSRRVVEKTCANSLRMDFVNAVFPNAQFIHIVRDGRAVAESARRRWLASLDTGYLLEKMQWVPVVDLPYYGLRYLTFQMHRLFSAEKSQGSWGPRFTGLDELVKRFSLIEVCGIQWKACVEAAESASRWLGPERVRTIRYEDLIRDSFKELGQIFEWLRLDFVPNCQTFACQQITSEHTDKWQNVLTNYEQEILLPHIRSTLDEFRYS